MTTAGRMKQSPPTIKPGHPARRKPRWIAISVEFGPGMSWVPPSRSRKRWPSSYFRRLTTSACIMAMRAAGPPKAVMPSLKK